MYPCKFGKNPLVHKISRRQEKCQANVNTNADRIHNKNSMPPTPEKFCYSWNLPAYLCLYNYHNCQQHPLCHLDLSKQKKTEINIYLTYDFHFPGQGSWSWQNITILPSNLNDTCKLFLVQQLSSRVAERKNKSCTVNPLYTDIQYNDKTQTIWMQRILSSRWDRRLDISKVSFLILQETYVVDNC